MFNIDFYETSDGFSDILEFLESLRNKAKTVKDARIQYGQVARYIELLQENGTGELMFFFIIFERRLRKLHQERLPEPNPK